MDAKKIWGIDPALKGLAIVRYDRDGHLATEFLEPQKRIRDVWVRIMDLRTQLRALLTNCGALGETPEAVFVEAPIVMVNSKGTISLASVFAMVKLTLNDMDIPMFEVQSSTWKRVVVGNGTSSKEQVQEILLAANPDLDPKMREDLWDALAILRYGQIQMKQLSD